MNILMNTYHRDTQVMVFLGYWATVPSYSCQMNMLLESYHRDAHVMVSVGYWATVPSVSAIPEQARIFLEEHGPPEKRQKALDPERAAAAVGKMGPRPKLVWQPPTQGC